MNEKEKENVKKQKKKTEEEGIWVRKQRKRKRSRGRKRWREEELTDRPDLAPMSDGGQRQWQRAEVRGQTFVIFFFHCWRVRAASEPYRRRVNAVSEKRKK